MDSITSFRLLHIKTGCDSVSAIRLHSKRQWIPIEAILGELADFPLSARRCVPTISSSPGARPGTIKEPATFPIPWDKVKLWQERMNIHVRRTTFIVVRPAHSEFRSILHRIEFCPSDLSITWANWRHPDIAVSDHEAQFAVSDWIAIPGAIIGTGERPEGTASDRTVDHPLHIRGEIDMTGK
jgi:hypothetical protein